MNCTRCGAELPAGVAFCPACGRSLGRTSDPGAVQMPSRCPSCGRSIQPEFKACPYCGHNLAMPVTSEPTVVISSGKRMGLYVLSVLIPLVGVIVGVTYLTKKDEESKHVGTICLVLGIVSIVVVAPIASALVLYLMVIGYGGDGHGWTPQATYARQWIVNGERITVLSVTRNDVPWDDVAIVLTDTTGNGATWRPDSDNLDDVSGDSMNYTGKSLGPLAVCCWVFDVVGNGLVDGGDYITLFTYGGASTLNAGEIYQAEFIYEPTGEQIGSSVIWTA